MVALEGSHLVRKGLHQGRMSKKRQRFPIFLCCVLVSAALLGCGGGLFGAGLPPPTARDVTISEIAGRYTKSPALLERTPDATPFTVVLYQDGTFEIHNAQIFAGVGTWNLNSKNKNLILVYDQRTVPAEMIERYSFSGSNEMLFDQWYVIDDPGEEEGAVTLLAGDSMDPDGWFGMDKIEAFRSEP
ncbi:MAG: hypothetical protein H0T73_19465 [Ardenticatenales bacterium]|nr:hypothetical protein [Ardenticatenales bacterium]